MKIRDILTEALTPDTIHKLADRKGIKWDNEPSFLALTNKLTGKEHLDDLDQAELKKVKQHLDKQGVAENFADDEIKESKETRQALSDQHFEFPQQGQYGYRTGYQGRGVLELADGRTGKIINLGEFGDFDDEYKPNQKWLRIVFTNPNMDDDAWNELEDMLWSDNQVSENFADGKNPQDKGDSQRHGIPKGATMTQLQKAAKAPGRKGQLARWQINMRRGKKK